VALEDRRDRAPGLPADRPRSDDRRPVGARTGHRASRQGGAGRARVADLSENLRLDRATHPHADPAGAAVPRGAQVREGGRAGGRAARRRPARGDHDMEGRRPRRRLRRLRPERTRSDDRGRVLDPADARRARFGAAALGRGPGRRPRGLHAGNDGTLGLEPADPDSFDDSSWPTRPTAPARSGRRGSWGA
jgi:hypothetical protein